MRRVFAQYAAVSGVRRSAWTHVLYHIWACWVWQHQGHRRTSQGWSAGVDQCLGGGVRHCTHTAGVAALQATCKL